MEGRLEGVEEPGGEGWGKRGEKDRKLGGLPGSATGKGFRRETKHHHQIASELF